MVEEWDYPSPSVYLDGDGHTALLIDYRDVGPDDEPTITWVDVEMEEERRVFANSFRELMQKLLTEQQRRDAKEQP